MFWLFCLFGFAPKISTALIFLTYFVRNIFLGLGSNLGDRGENLKKALVSLEKWEVSLVKTSSIYEAQPLGDENKILKDDQGQFQTNYFNMVVEVETARDPEDLLKIIHTIEKALGRDRKTETVRNMPRVIDIDILFFGDKSVDLSEGGLLETDKKPVHLLIPHPKLQDRKFVLMPMVEIAPTFIHPVLKKSMDELLKECNDKSIVTVLR